MTDLILFGIFPYVAVALAVAVVLVQGWTAALAPASLRVLQIAAIVTILSALAVLTALAFSLR